MTSSWRGPHPGVSTRHQGKNDGCQQIPPLCTEKSQSLSHVPGRHKPGPGSGAGVWTRPHCQAGMAIALKVVTSVLARGRASPLVDGLAGMSHGLPGASTCTFDVTFYTQHPRTPSAGPLQPVRFLLSPFGNEPAVWSDSPAPGRMARKCWRSRSVRGAGNTE